MRTHLPQPTLPLISIGLALASLFMGHAAAAQPKPPFSAPAASATTAPQASPTGPLEPPAEAPDSPRASVRAFLELTAQGNLGPNAWRIRKWSLLKAFFWLE